MYQSVYPYVDVKLDIMAQTVKETLILNDPKAHSAEFSYFIAAKGLTARLIEDNMVIFVNKDEETVFTIPPAYMFDSSETEEICFNIDTKIVSYNDGYLLTYLPDQNWIHSDERVFPVMLDPTIITTIKTASDSAYISEENPNVRYTDNFLKMGGSYGNRFESFISFPVNYANQTNGMFQMNYNGYTLSWVMMDISSEYSAIKNIPEPCILNEQQHSISLKNRNVTSAILQK